MNPTDVNPTERDAGTGFVAGNREACGNIALRARGITKIYPGTTALAAVDFDAQSAKVNVLLGENGAGKSTLMKILSGAEQPNGGRIFFGDTAVQIRSTVEASDLGIRIIHQELNLFPNMSVAENIFIGREFTKFEFVDHRRQEAAAGEILARMEQDIDPRAMVGDLPIGQQQIVEIAKALTEDLRLLIMDEPTSALSRAEVAALFKIIRELKARGVTIIYISHRLEEVMEIGDFVTVLRDGRVAATAQISEIDIPWIIRNMVGRESRGAMNRDPSQKREEVLRVVGITVPKAGRGNAVDDVSFSIHAGEVVGFYGLMGAGRTELFECLIGMRREAAGNVWLAGQHLGRKNVANRIRDGLVLVPEDRQTDGLIQNLSVAANATLPSLWRYVRAFLIRGTLEKKDAASIVVDLSIKAPDIEMPVTALSGGNQQKVVIGRFVLTAPKVILLDEPTRGIDVGAKEEVFKMMRRLADGGVAIGFATSELDEVLTVADRVIVMSAGRLAGEYACGDVTRETLVTASAAAHRADQPVLA